MIYDQFFKPSCIYIYGHAGADREDRVNRENDGDPQMRRRSRTGSGTGVTTNKPCLLNEFGRGASTYRSHPERVLA